jgi:hypothetical protein
MKSVDVIVPYSSIIDTMLWRKPGKNRRDADRRHHANHNAEHSEKAAKLVRRTLSSAIASVSRGKIFGN